VQVAQDGAAPTQMKRVENRSFLSKVNSSNRTSDISIEYFRIGTVFI